MGLPPPSVVPQEGVDHGISRGSRRGGGGGPGEDPQVVEGVPRLIPEVPRGHRGVVHPDHVVDVGEFVHVPRVGQLNRGEIVAAPFGRGGGEGEEREIVDPVRTGGVNQGVPRAGGSQGDPVLSGGQSPHVEGETPSGDVLRRQPQGAVGGVGIVIQVDIHPSGVPGPGDVSVEGGVVFQKPDPIDFNVFAARVVRRIEAKGVQGALPAPGLVGNRDPQVGNVHHIDSPARPDQETRGTADSPPVFGVDRVLAPEDLPEGLVVHLHPEGENLEGVAVDRVVCSDLPQQGAPGSARIEEPDHGVRGGAAPHETAPRKVPRVPVPLRVVGEPPQVLHFVHVPGVLKALGGILPGRSDRLGRGGRGDLQLSPEGKGEKENQEKRRFCLHSFIK